MRWMTTWQALLARHGMPVNSRNEGSKCVLMTWRAISGRPCSPLAARGLRVAHGAVGAAAEASAQGRPR